MRQIFWGGEMRQVVLIASATVLGFAVSGCDFISGLGGGETTTTEQSPVAVSPSPTASPNFPQPTVAQKNAPKGILPPDLISSTDPNQRVQQIKGDRNDPFALLPTTPSVQLAEGAEPQTTGLPPGGTPPTAARTTPQTRQAAQPNRGSTAARSPARPAARTPARPAPRSPIAANPPRPQPILAEAVAVTGVVQVGDQVFAIVNAPNEPTSRYVREGQRLAGGQVLVRRIETNRAEPLVVLEQYGVEVVRAVGEGGTPVPANGTPAATIPATNPTPAS